MKPEIILRSDVLDILFENRNKSYGAYLLRKNYHFHLYAGITAMVLVVAISWLFGTGKKHRATDLFNFPPVDSVKLVIIDLPPIQSSQLPTLPKRSEAATIKNVSPVIIKDLVRTEVPENETLADAIIGVENKPGDPTGFGDRPESIGNGDETTNSTKDVQEDIKPEILASASVMPEFPGGRKALYRWLSKELRSQEDLEPGQKLRVLVRFAVGIDGSISQVQIVQNGGDSFDNEVLRVIKKMPNWSPGQQNGRPVAVWFNLPVIFEMPEL